MTLGENLKEKRLQRGLSLRQLEKEVGINCMTLSSYEKNKISPSIYMIWDLADFFGCSIDELCGRKESTYEQKENRTN